MNLENKKELKSPPGLTGTIFSEEEKEQAKKNRSLLFISLMTDPICNLLCPDCYVGKKKLSGNELNIEERKSVLNQAKKCGARTLRIAGTGEPLLDRYFWRTIDYAINNLQLDVFFFTNGTLINKSLAKKITEYDKLTPVLKFSGSPDVMESLTINKGYFARNRFVKNDGILIPVYLKNMLDTGINIPNKNEDSRLGIEFLLRKSNFGYVFDIFRWCRRNNIIPYVEQNLESGCAVKWDDYKFERVADDDAFALSKRLLEIDEKEFGFTWKPSIPYLVGGICESEKSGCKKFTYNLIVSPEGDMNLCYATYFSLGNIRENTLKEGLEHPTRKKLLKNPRYNCLCRVFSKSSQQKAVSKLDDLNPNFDYKYQEEIKCSN